MRQQLAGAVVLGLFLSGCAASPDAAEQAGSASADPSPTAAPAEPSPSPSPSPADGDAPEQVEASPAAQDEADGEEEADETTARLSDEELAALGVNELGRVLVGEWHRIGDTDGEYRTSRETFRTQLQALYDRGFRPVTQAEFIAGTFPIPAGTSPVLLTFDDSTRDQFALGDDGEPAPDTAVGIIEDFAADKPEWRATAVFAYNFPQPFGDAGFAEKLQWLHANGYEFANHSVGHANFGSMGSAAVAANLAENQARLQEVVPDAPVPALTLPLGIHAEDPTVELAGTADGTTYRHELVYLVGAYPTRSPHDVEFDPAAIQRVPAHAVVGSGPEWFWDRLDELEQGGGRFVSDGDPSTVTYPVDLADSAAVADPDLTERTYPDAE